MGSSLTCLGEAIKSKSNETRVCTDRDLYNGKLVKKVVGTFKDGTLNGPCRVFFADDISMIGTFVNGDPKGLLRAFDAKGQLISKENFGVFNSPKKQTKTIRLEVP